MPELPEVETIARRLQEPLLGRRVAGIQLLWERTLAEPTPEVFGQRIVGPRLCSLRRRGKFLVFGLSGRLFLLVHLRMTGRLEVLPPEAPRSPHTRVIFDLDDGRELRFADARKFGRIWLVDDPEVVLGDLGPEPLAEAFTAEVFRELLAGRQGRIKPLLLDQRFLAGLGNIYADEALHLAGVHPCRPACSLTEEEAGRLHQAIRQVLQEAIGDGGTTLMDYRQPDGSAGSHQEALRVSRRAGEPCPCCGTLIVREVVGGRGTYYCPRCQPEAKGDAVPQEHV